MRKTLPSVVFVFMFLLSQQTWAAVQTVTVANFSFSPNSFTIALGDSVQWVWSNGSHTTTSGTIPAGAASWNNNMSSTSTTFIYVPTVSGTYNYVCTPHASSGMTGSFIVTGCVNPSKPAITSSNGASACVGATPPISLSVPAQGGATYQWFHGSSQVSGAITSSLNVATVSANAGAYTVKVSRCGVDSVSSPFNVTINTLPIPAFTESHSGLSYSFINTTPSIASNTYLWTFSDGSPAQSTTNASRNFTSAGNYTVTLKATTTATSCFNVSSPFAIQAKLGVGTLAGASYAILPNPAASAITVIAPAEALTCLTDLSGHNVAAPTSQNNTQRRIDVSALPAGMYLLRISLGGALLTEKISVAH